MVLKGLDRGEILMHGTGGFGRVGSVSNVGREMLERSRGCSRDWIEDC
jgi:hypothetical protein